MEGMQSLIGSEALSENQPESPHHETPELPDEVPTWMRSQEPQDKQPISERSARKNASMTPESFNYRVSSRQERNEIQKVVNDYF